MNKRSKLSIAFAAVMIIVLTLVGYISNALSGSFCERQVASWLLNEVLGQQFFYVQPHENSPNLCCTLDSMGASYSSLPADADRQYPRLGMVTHTWLPFLVYIDYEWEREPLIGGGGRKWFFCFVRSTWEIAETNQHSM